MNKSKITFGKIRLGTTAKPQSNVNEEPAGTSSNIHCFINFSKQKKNSFSWWFR
jgi:hypothetical protein